MKIIDHSKSQIDLPFEVQILNISVNLSRLSQWVYEGFEIRRELINKFIDQTQSFTNDLKAQPVSEKFKPTLERFQKEFEILKGQKIKEENKLFWAEKALTWANILQHRAKLA